MATQPLNTSTSIVDALKSKGQASDFNSRAALAKQYGITNYTGSTDQNVALLTKFNGTPAKTAAPAVASPAPVVTPPKNINEANTAINSNQQNDFNTASKGNEPPVRSSVQSYQDIYDNITKSLTSNLPAKPAAPNLTQTYNDLRTSYGVNDLEGSLSELQKQARDIQAASKARTDAELGKPVALNVIAGRVTEEERQDNERLAAVNSSIQTVTSQLQTKYNVIDNVMKYTGLDYSNAADAYDKQFSQNISMFNAAKGIQDSQQTAADREQDNARANAQIIYNSIQTGGLKLEEIDPTQKTAITKLELQSGLPAGFYENLQSKNPKADIVTSTTRETNGSKYVDVIMRNPDGSLSTQSMRVGSVDKAGSGTKPTEAETTRGNAAKVASQLKGRAGEDGYVSPEDYKTARRAWVASGYTAKDFDERFGTSFVNPDSYDQAGVSSSVLN